MRSNNRKRKKRKLKKQVKKGLIITGIILAILLIIASVLLFVLDLNNVPPKTFKYSSSKSIRLIAKSITPFSFGKFKLRGHFTILFNKIKEKPCNLLITPDSSSSDREWHEKLYELGCDVVVADHQRIIVNVSVNTVERAENKRLVKTLDSDFFNLA